jgi:small GTP-binding protein
MIQNSIDYNIKCIILGDSGVGKTTLLKKITKTLTSLEHLPTIGVDIFTITKNIENSNIKIQIYDTAGQERYKNLVKTYYKNNSICFIVYDVCKRSSFDAVDFWLKTFKNNSSNPKALIVIIANKIDNNKRIISYNEGKTLADYYKTFYFETSTKLPVNLENIIIEPVTQLLYLYKKRVFEPIETNGFRDINLDIDKYKLQNKKKCCIIQ